MDDGQDPLEGARSRRRPRRRERRSERRRRFPIRKRRRAQRPTGREGRRLRGKARALPDPPRRLPDPPRRRTTARCHVASCGRSRRERGSKPIRSRGFRSPRRRRGSRARRGTRKGISEIGSQERDERRAVELLFHVDYRVNTESNLSRG